MRGIAHEFPLNDGLIYLNHAAVGVWPRRTAESVKQFADENMQQGAQEYPRWMQCEQSLRRRFARLVGSPSADDIALVKNTSEGLSLIAYGLDWQAGDNIVSTLQEFPSNRIVWESLAGQGVELRQADVSGDDPEEAIIACMDMHTRLLSVSSVQFGNGLRLDLKRLDLACKERGILFCVDAIQSLGALQFDVVGCHADFVVADGHKWMLGPEGVAVFYSHPAAREHLNLCQYGWHMVEHAGDFDRRDWQAAKSARRFEPGSPNMLGIHALDASLSLFEEVGISLIEAEVLKRSEWLTHAMLSDDRLVLLSPSEAGRMSGIVSFRRRDLDAAGHAALYRHLMKAGLICALRCGGIRFSPHFYTPMPQLAQAMAMAATYQPSA
ncbi:MAG: aminotransferase [Zetaproteobacteria bacterium CG12_big_fil_rev_8_21_14_0_65_55_1124]|nr:MAG: class V aminotransferase [Zetaproteobacteria bacterium CG1_02_55_237]PIS20227.1 MAG: aminotransferase [Zetaproteobacteria bacterium CG08_land_8_20_14_0_20_55_17]PIW43384.1 MAG: aminotransferase [Zetaproteobacteria bacterium CG12_big_fil_rev_8_21_14_0_65_55_1124]PIY53091.1 MAG: aminotransferase [Zetaproteobacteria bacterium CG_4_10_14_0_8_um_filter_55_43]PIZ40000.1 MAG: aminotransferase [Zetaproteobacteria bacterium CG_4_10_14_0_2_um_filter_55_20]PJB81286.1 MAG: aminotransferase [Zetapr